MAKFGIYIVRKFAQVSLDNPKVFAELLFWKTARDAAEIELGYGNYKELSFHFVTFLVYLLISLLRQCRPNSESRSAWTEEEEDELQRLYEEFKNVQDPGKHSFHVKKVAIFLCTDFGFVKNGALWTS